MRKKLGRSFLVMVALPFASIPAAGAQGVERSSTQQQASDEVGTEALVAGSVLVGGWLAIGGVGLARAKTRRAHRSLP